MFAGKKEEQQVEDVLSLFDAIRSESDMFHPKTEDQLEWMMNAQKSCILERRGEDDRLIAALLISDAKYFQSGVETYDFLRYLIGSHVEEDDGISLAERPDIFWLEGVCVEKTHRRRNIAEELVEEALEYARGQAGILPCIVACGIMVDNAAARALVEKCGFEMIEHTWTPREFISDKSYGKDFAWNIFYKVVVDRG